MIVDNDWLLPTLLHLSWLPNILLTTPPIPSPRHPPLSHPFAPSPSPQITSPRTAHLPRHTFLHLPAHKNKPNVLYRCEYVPLLLSNGRLKYSCRAMSDSSPKRKRVARSPTKIQIRFLWLCATGTLSDPARLLVLFGED